MGLKLLCTKYIIFYFLRSYICTKKWPPLASFRFLFAAKWFPFRSSHVIILSRETHACAVRENVHPLGDFFDSLILILISHADHLRVIILTASIFCGNISWELSKPRCSLQRGKRGKRGLPGRQRLRLLLWF